jgi:hypothetical protein
MTVGELIDLLAKMPRESIIVLEQADDNSGEYETIEVCGQDDEVILRFV